MRTAVDEFQSKPGFGVDHSPVHSTFSKVLTFTKLIQLIALKQYHLTRSNPFLDVTLHRVGLFLSFYHRYTTTTNTNIHNFHLTGREIKGNDMLVLSVGVDCLNLANTFPYRLCFRLSTGFAYM